MNKIFVTGASGFIGMEVCKVFSELKYSVCGAVRNKDIISQLPNVKYVSVGDIILNSDLKNLLAGYDCVIHCAGLPQQKKVISKKIYERSNVEITKKLAEQCVIAGVKKFIFLSSISVLGTNTNNNIPFKYSDKVNPNGDYAHSKFEAEKKLLEITAKNSLEVIILRPPIVYGLGAKGNMNRLIKILKLNLPLPFGLVKNKKSFINIDNLISVLICCVKHPNLKGKVFLVSDGEDVSLQEFLLYIAEAAGQRLVFFSIPILLLKFIFHIFGKGKEINKLLSNLQVDINYTRDILNWKPSTSVKDGVRKMMKCK
jgi:nucleoside-diphosphate-sugar epimerase